MAVLVRRQATNPYVVGSMHNGVTFAVIYLLVYVYMFHAVCECVCVWWLCL